MGKSKYAVVEHFDFTRPYVTILNDVTYDECCEYIKKVVQDHVESDLEHGWKSDVEEISEDTHYRITTHYQHGTMTVDVMMAYSIIRV